MAYFKSLSIYGTSTRRLPFQLYNTSDPTTGLAGVGVTYGEVDGVPPLGMEDQTDYILYANGEGDWLAVLELDFNDTNFDLNTDISGCKIFMCRPEKLPDNTSSLNSQASSYIPPDWSSVAIPQGQVGQGANSFGLESSYQPPAWSLPGAPFGLESSYKPPAWSLPGASFGLESSYKPPAWSSQAASFGLEGVHSPISKPNLPGTRASLGTNFNQETSPSLPPDSKPSDGGVQNSYINKYMIIGDINVTKKIDGKTSKETFVYVITKQNFTGDVYAEQALYVSSDNGDEKFFADYGSIDLVDTTYAMNIQSNTITLYDVSANGGGALDVANAGEFLELAIDDNGVTSIYGYSGDEGVGPSFEIFSDDTGNSSASGDSHVSRMKLLSGDEAESLEMEIDDTGTSSVYGFSGTEALGPSFEIIADDTGEHPISTIFLTDGDGAESLEMQIDGAGTSSIYGYSGQEGIGPWFEIIADDTGVNPISTIILSNGDEAESLEIQIDGAGTSSIYGYSGGEGQGPWFEIISNDKGGQGTVILSNGDETESLEMQIDKAGTSTVYGFAGGNAGDPSGGPNFELLANSNLGQNEVAGLNLDCQASNGVVSYTGSTATQNYDLLLNERERYCGLSFNSAAANNNFSMSLDSLADTCYWVAGVKDNSQNFSLTLDGQSSVSALSVFGDTESLIMQVDNEGISAIAGGAGNNTTTFDITANDTSGKMQINGGAGGNNITFQLLADDNNNEASLILYDGSTTNTTKLNTSSLTTTNENGPGFNLDIGDEDVALNLSDDYNNFGNSNNSVLNTTALTITNAGGVSGTLEVNDGDAFLYLNDGDGNSTTINTTEINIVASNPKLTINDASGASGALESDSGEAFLYLTNGTGNSTTINTTEINMVGDNPTITINDNGQTVILDSAPEGNATWQQLTVCVNGVSKTMYVFGTTPK